MQRVSVYTCVHVTALKSTSAECTHTHTHTSIRNVNTFIMKMKTCYICNS